MNYCTHCGGPLSTAVPAGEDRLRQVCARCGAIHYRNPKIVTGCLPLWQNRILMCRRAIEPRRGFWTLPCGYLEEGETVEAGAIRETLEESLAKVRLKRLFSVVSLPEISQVYLVFLAELEAPEFGPTHESDDVRLVRQDEIPWDALAFPAVEFVLRAYVREGVEGLAVHMGSCTWPEGAHRRAT